ncbi:hypothetical protein [Acidiphilium angustum]|uniref:hypothetical protein n=1 Tax=Acidiphilium angustum TaxID=523 RepID=UPI0012DCBD5F|nr:hypothetical protein [Acidiphilium angustum]
MTDPTELIAQISRDIVPDCDCSGCVRAKRVNDMLATLAAERDAALKQVRSMATDALIDQNQALGAYAKPAAPRGETVRVRIPVHHAGHGTLRINYRYANGSDDDFFERPAPFMWITADVPLPQPAEVVGAVESSHEG